ncbi:hypothetical protein [Novosphingobium sp.]|uniref:hypothetical protein n=1 Tax=Novosphingobium sp. TaxID=1874826 RepID=UPI0035AE3D6F
MRFEKTAISKAIALLALPTALSASTSAFAQAQQTPENAQKFLELIIKQGATKTYANASFRRSMDSGWNCDGMSECYFEQEKHGTLYWVSSTDKCITNLQVYLTEAGWRGDHSWINAQTNPVPVTIYWANVSASKTDGNNIYLSGSPPIKSLTFATPEVASRVNTAINVLLKACDPTTGTGF